MQAVFVKRRACPLCESEDRAILKSVSFTDPGMWDFLEIYYDGRARRDALEGNLYEVARCNYCGFIWQTNIFSEAWMGKLYNEWIDSESSISKRKRTGYGVYAAEVERIGVLFPQHERAEIDVLDFGMGWGFWCMAAQAAGYTVKGLEISADRITYARGNGIDVIDSVQGHLFDFINAEQVFEHVADPVDTLKGLVTSLKKNGVMSIAVPDGSDIEEKLENPDWEPAKDAIHPLEHINCFTHQTLTRLGQSAGLRVIPQPVVFRSRNMAKGVLASLYRQFFGTTLYFRKMG